jgi:peptide/nickel transport system substrate-binding protein
MDVFRLAVSSRIVSVLTASMLAASACGPASAPTAPTSTGLAAAATPATSAQQVAPLTPTAVGAPAPTASSNTGQPAKGGRLVYGTFADAKTLNPVLSDDVNSSDVWGRIYETLTQADSKTGQPMPRLAEKFDVSADNKTFTFTLRDGLKWSDGSAFSGEDFKFTAEAVMRSKKTVRKNIFQDIVGAKDYGDGKAEDISGITVNGNTITVQMTAAFCPALIQIGGFGIIPKSVFGKYFDPVDASKNLDDAPENNNPPIAMGPFKFKEWVPNDHITLVRNDLFYGGAANLDEWVMKVYPNQTALTAALKTGELDVGTIEPKDLQDLQQVSTLAFHTWPSLGYTYIGWNQLRGGKEFFQDKSVRQALTYGLNMDQVIEKILFGQGTKMVAHTPPVSWAYDATGLNQYPYDPAKAQQLLEQDGWTKGADGVYAKNGQPLAFDIYTNSGNNTRETLLQVATEQYKQIGINVNPKTESFEALVDRLNKSKDPTYGDQGGHDFDAVILGWALGNDPDPYGIWHSSQIGSGNNFVGFNNADADKAMIDGRTMCDQADRKAAYNTFNKIVNDEQPYDFGFASNVLYFVNKKFQGVDPGPYSRVAFWNIEKWYIQQ